MKRFMQDHTINTCWIKRKQFTILWLPTALSNCAVVTRYASPLRNIRVSSTPLWLATATKPLGFSLSMSASAMNSLPILSRRLVLPIRGRPLNSADVAWQQHAIGGDVHRFLRMPQLSSAIAAEPDGYPPCAADSRAPASIALFPPHRDQCQAVSRHERFLCRQHTHGRRNGLPRE